MAEKQASDLFFTAGAPIQIKINGVVMPINSQVLSPAAVRQIAYEMMSEDQIKEFEKTLESYFGVGRSGVGRFRVNVFRQRDSMAMVIRFIKADIQSLDELKMPAVLKELVMEKLGLILVVGSTGSGKSTTLASMIDYRSSTRTGHILTLEDPIEFCHKHKQSIVNQREIGMDSTSMENALLSALHEAPDVLMIGEIRDRATLQSALLFAQTGHLCLSTLHANNSYHAITRILNMFPREARDALLADLSITLRGVISQRMIRAAHGGRVPAVEVLLNTPRIAELIMRGEIDRIKDAMDQSLEPGNRTFEQALFELYRSGQITLNDALVNADSSTNLQWLIDNTAMAPAATPSGTPWPATNAPAAAAAPGDRVY